MNFKTIIFAFIACFIVAGLVLADSEDQNQPIGKHIVTIAKQYVGNPYIWGGNSLTQGCDCSHFVWLVLRQAINYKGEYTTSWGFETLGQQIISLQEAKAGDIICYGEHVAIYDGQGYIIEAQSSAAGITDNRKVDEDYIVTIRRIIS